MRSHTQEAHPFADLNGKIMSYTADELTYSPDPPACYGMIQFEVGGRIMMDFTDIEPRDLEVGRAMRHDVPRQRPRSATWLSCAIFGKPRPRRQPKAGG